MKFIYFFLCLWVIFALLDPDPDSDGPDTDPGTPLNLDTDTDPDPQHWLPGAVWLRFPLILLMFPGAAVPAALPQWRWEHPLAGVVGAYPGRQCRGRGCRRRLLLAAAAYPGATGPDATSGSRSALLRQYCPDGLAAPAVRPTAAVATWH
jgi:hypothetical protein